MKSARETGFQPGQTLDLEAANASSNSLQDWLNSGYVLSEDWEALPSQTQAKLLGLTRKEDLLGSLVGNGLLTQYQGDRIAAGTTFGLVLGNYRILDRLGAGGMGVVFQAEHIRLRCPVAVKVLPFSSENNERLLHRFFAEMRTVALLKHPNIVGAMDAGEVKGGGSDPLVLFYFVMEYVPGQDLEQFVLANGPLPAAKACSVIYQVAAALGEAHKHQLVHRDIKPPNVRLTPSGQAKLVDFGLVRRFSTRMTEPGTILGTLDYLAPEQAQDASAVDIRADIYGLGGTLYWCLTGKPPFTSSGNIVTDIYNRLAMEPPSPSRIRSDLPPELDEIVRRMMARNPQDRYPDPQAMMAAISPFVSETATAKAFFPSASFKVDRPAELSSSPRVLVVDDSATVREFCSLTLEEEGLLCEEAENAEVALQMVQERPYDLVLTDWLMPGMNGLELCRKLREKPPSANLKIIVFSGAVEDEQLALVLAAGADDYLAKKSSPVQLVARVKAALNQKSSQDRTDRLFQQLLKVNNELERNLAVRDSDLLKLRSALVMGLTSLVEHRHFEAGSHLVRLQQFCRILATEAEKMAGFSGQIDPAFIDMLEACVPLHDIGNIALPEQILAKPGRFDPDERIIMQSHTVIGAETLQRVAQRHGAALSFLEMAIDIVRHHHEHYDGSGYPDGLKGNAIPLAARIVTICDRYEALRSRRSYRPGLSHAAAMQVMIEPKNTCHFDPDLFQAFRRSAQEFETIYRTLPDGTEV